MHTEILTIGDELLRGDLSDRNGSWLAAELHQLGVEVTAMSSIGDGLQAISDRVRAISARCEVLVITGGLGPTDDDRTARAVAQAAGVSLRQDQASLERIEAFFRRLGRVPAANNEQQTWLPEGATVLTNDRGTAPGFAIDIASCSVYCMPGVPHEMRAMFSARVVPDLRRRFALRAAERLTVKTFGIGESDVAMKLTGLLNAVDAPGCDVSLHYRTHFPENHVTLLVRPANASLRSAAQTVLEQLRVAVLARLGHYVFTVGQGSFAEAVVAALRNKGATVSFAESCTGGGVADLLTGAPGSSDVFPLSVVAYAPRFKQQLLAVPAATIQAAGAVSESCAKAMAEGVRELSGTDYGLATTGLAGPEGDGGEAAPGTVHLALASAAGTRHVTRQLPFGRQRTKRATAYLGLWMILREVTDSWPSGEDLFESRLLGDDPVATDAKDGKERERCDPL